MSGMVKVEVLRAACCVAGANGEVCGNENLVLNRIAKETGVGQASLEAMISRACSDQSFCDEQFRVLKADPTEAMAILLEVAMSDGAIDNNEATILKVLAGKLDVPDQVFESLMIKAAEIASKK